MLLCPSQTRFSLASNCVQCQASKASCRTPVAIFLDSPHDDTISLEQVIHVLFLFQILLKSSCQTCMSVFL